MAGLPSQCRRCGDLLGVRDDGGVCARCLARAAFGAFPDAPHALMPAAASFPRPFGPYELLDEIGRGGMGIVYRARHAPLNREVAIKVLPSPALAEPARLARFQIEARASARLRHPNIVTLHDFGEIDGQPYLVMDLVSGRNLAEITRSGPLDPHEAAHHLALAARAVAHAHAQGVLHRDLKPANILIDSANEPQITDFGLAKEMDATVSLTGSREVFGSPGYMPPEQADPSFGEVGFASDVYSLGATFYHLLTGRAPFLGATSTAILHQALHSEPVSPRQLNPAVPKDLETVILKCLRKEPARRYATALQLADDLERFLRDEPVQARPVGSMERSWRWCRRRPVIAGLSALLLLSLIAVALTATVAAFRINRLRQLEADGRESAEANLYAADMVAVQQAWDERNLGRARQLLETHRPRPGEKDRRGFEWHLLHKWVRGDHHEVLLQENQPFTAMALATDETRVSLVTPTELIAYDLPGRRILRRWPLPERKEARKTSISEGNRWIATTETNGLWLHNIETGERTILPTGPCDTVAFASGANVVAICDALHSYRYDRPTAIEVWDFAKQERIGGLPDYGGPALHLDPTGKTLRAVGQDATFLTWQLPFGRPRIVQYGDDWNDTAAFSRSGQLAIRSDAAGNVQLIDTRDASVEWVRSNAAPRGVAVSVEGDRFEAASHACSANGQLIEFRCRDNSGLAGTIAGHMAWVPACHLYASNQFVLSAGADGLFASWSTAPRPTDVLVTNDLRNVGGHRPQFSRSGKWAAMTISNVRGDDPGSTAVFDATSWKKSAVLPGGVVGFLGAADDLVLWQPKKGLSIYHLPECSRTDSAIGKEAANVAFIHLSDDTRRIGLHGSDESLVVHEFPSGRAIATNELRCWWYSFVPNSQSLIICTPTEIVEWNPDANESKILLSVFSEEIAFSPDGSLLAVGGWDHKIYLIDYPSKRLLCTLIGHQGGVTGLAITPDKTTLVSSGEDKAIRFWNLQTRREVAKLSMGHPAYWLSLSPSGGSLVVGDLIFYRAFVRSD
ncbi:MAG: hypothetical protein EXS36_11250 [Pedosphaera sp.]|nr:hypothetical protein [Pedosphaera sp.]